MIQTLQGVQIIPQGNNNRFIQESWPNSFAFGGWIYAVQTTIGFSNKPTEVKISIVLKTTTFSQASAYFDINDADLLVAVAFDRIAEHAEAGIVDEIVEFDLFGRKGSGDPIAGIRLLEIAGNHDRLLAARAGEFVRERLEPVRTSRRQREAMPVRGKHARQLRADARLSAGDQRYPLSHDPSLLIQVS